MAVQIEILKRLNYFISCSDEELIAIKKFITQKTAKKGEIFLFQDDWSDYLYFLVSGWVKVYKTSASGKEQILHIVDAGDSINDVSTFDVGPNAANMQAMTPVTLYRIKKPDLQNIIKKHPQIALNAIKALAARIRRDSSLVEDLSFSQVTGRLAKLLLRLSKTEEHTWPKLTQQDMAGMIGTTREVVNRSLRIMEEKGAIRMERRGIAITNKETLEEIMRIFS